MSKRNSKQDEVRSEPQGVDAVSEAGDAASAAAGDGRQAGHASSDGVAGDDAAADVDVVDPDQQVAELRDELLRRQADYENFRKRMNRDKEEAIKFANSALLMDLTAVIDDFERAIQSSQETDDVGALRSGLELIEKQLTGMLERKWGLSRFSSEGEPFDPERHEALAQEPSTDHDVATVVEDYQKGFLLHGRVVRAARVRVATPSAGADATPAAAASDPGEAEGEQ